MVRRWDIDPELLCDNHLLGEHKEIHQEVGTLKNHPHGRSIVLGHLKKLQFSFKDLEKRHNELENEMKARGMNPDSPLELVDPTSFNLPKGHIDILFNLIDLSSRCKECREKIIKKLNLNQL